MKRYIFLFFLIISPGIWWIIPNRIAIVREWSKFPEYSWAKITSIYNPERVTSVGIMRWADKDTNKIQIVYSKVMYNKVTLLVDEFFDFISFLSPRFYFQAGDGSTFSPPEVEPIPLLLFPLWILGLVAAVEKKRIKVFIFLIVATLFASIVGRKTMSFLWPVMVLYIYLGSLGFGQLSGKQQKWGFLVLTIYSLYLGGRVLWIII